MIEQTGEGAPAADPTVEPGFPGFEPAAPANPPASVAAPYRVLARKYRPQSFDDLIGQDVMVRTVSNAFSSGRVPQAWMLTGVRGVGKTTTARILARALNYVPTSGPPTGPTTDISVPGLHCGPIMESRHVDVTEIDAASHTGVENIRQITDAVRYAPAQAPFKVYIIDEVHMLSTAAFNAFLKTLEEPPPHAKFVFATTEIRKVPVTILSRCQRFDLRRVEAATLVAHLARICGLEGVGAEPDALATIARAAEGSVRDALSLLDQAVAHGAGSVSSRAVSDMLGLADRGQVADLFEAVMRGNVAAAFGHLRSAWDAGADPAGILADLAGFIHLVSRIKMVPDAARDPALTEVERVRGADYAGRLSVRALSRAWQIVSRAVGEVGAAPRPLPAAEMALVRVAYAADLPTPDETLRRLREDGPAPPALARPDGPGPAAGLVSSSGGGAGGGGGGGSGGSALASVARPVEIVHAVPEPAGPVLRRFADVVALAGERREIGLKTALERDVRPVRFDEGRIEVALASGASRTLPTDLARALAAWTGRRWIVALSGEAGEATVAERRALQDTERRTDAASHPLVQAVLETFPGAEIVDVRDRTVPEPGPDPAGAGPDAEPPIDNDDEA